MTPTRRIEDMVRNARITTSTTTDARVADAVEAAITKQNEQRTASVRTGGAIRRIIMKSNWTKLATAATVIVAIGLGMYVLTGSGTSITMAEVRQALQEIDWVRMDCRNEDMKLTAWYSFKSKVEIGVFNEGKIIYYDFNTGKMLTWNPGSEDIYESDIEEGRQFAHGVSSIYEALTQGISSWEADGSYKVTKEPGTYQGRKIETWTARRIKGEPKLTRTEAATIYIDVEKKLLLKGTDVKGAYGDVQQTNHVEFTYPDTGPADIYEAGAPRSAQIKPAPDQ
jgi:hypothetical protein